MTEMYCPASMCPLIAAKGSPWTGEYNARCPEHDKTEAGGCAWWSMACSVGGIQRQVDDAAKQGGRVFVAGPNKPKHPHVTPQYYECPRAQDCSWQKQAGDGLCPPRNALSRGMDPRVALY